MSRNDPTLKVIDLFFLLIIFVALGILTGCKTVKNTNVYIVAHGSDVMVEATTRGSEPRDIFNGNDAAVKWK